MKGKEMRSIADCNSGKRGCGLCADTEKRKVKINGAIVTHTFCLYDECPYHELDNVESYSQYEKSAKKKQESWLKKVFELSEKYIDCQKST